MNSALIACFLLGMVAIQMSAALPSDCTLERDEGMCMGNFPRYFYNVATAKCEEFIFGGCQGNANNFEKLEDCEAFCF